MPLETSAVLEHPVFDIVGARASGASDDQILGFLKQKFSKVYDYDAALKAGANATQINDFVSHKLNTTVNPSDIGFGSWGDLKKALVEGKDKAIDFIKPIADSAATTAGASAGAIGGPVGSVLGGATAGIATDALLQKLQSRVAQDKNRTTLAEATGTKPGSAGETFANAVQNEGLNELLGKAFNIVGSKVKALLGGETPLESLKPTFSQSGTGKPGMLSSMIENIWGAGDKTKALENSSNIAREKFGNLIESKSMNPADRFNIGRLNNQFEKGKATVEDIGRLNTVTLPGSQPLASGNVNPFPTSTTVEGPVFLTRTADEAKAFLAEKQKVSQSGDFKGFTDSDNKLVKTAQEIVENTDGGMKPIPFKTALSLLHGEGEVSPTKDILGNIGDSLHRDIQDSLTKWKDGDVALKSYNEARASALTKQTLAEGGTVQNLIQSTNGPIPSIEKALQNPSQTQKLLNTSNLEGVKSNNMAQDLRGYRLQQIWGKADSGSGVINGDKLLTEWNDPAYAATKDQLFSKQAQQQIGEFFQNVKQVTQAGAGTTYGPMRLGYTGIHLAANMLTGSVTGHSLGTFAAIEIPPYALAKIFTNPARAMVLNRLITGAPLEMSTQQAGRLLMGGLNGVTVSLVDNDGKKKNVVVRDGKIQ